MSIIKTALFFLVLVSMTFGGIYVKKSASSFVHAPNSTHIAPIIIADNGAVRFPERFPAPEAVFQIQSAARRGDFKTLNELLIKHNFYLLPEATQ